MKIYIAYVNYSDYEEDNDIIVGAFDNYEKSIEYAKQELETYLKHSFECDKENWTYGIIETELNSPKQNLVYKDIES